MPIDDPTTSPRTGDVATTNTADLVATLVLLVVHGGLFAATYVLLGLLVMSTDPCGYQSAATPPGSTGP